MKREDIIKAKLLERDLSELEMKLAHFRDVKKLHIMSGCNLDIEDYPEPSMIGAGFRGVRASIVQMLEGQIAQIQRELESLGVTFQ